MVARRPSSRRISESALRHFPTDGLAATITISAACSPDVSISKSVKPVATPVTVPFSWYRLSIFSKLAFRISLIVWKSWMLRRAEIP